MTSPPAHPSSAIAKKGTRRFLLRFVSGWLLVSSTAIAVSAQLPKGEGSPRSEARAQSIVHGRVIYDDTRRPLRRIWVTIYDPAWIPTV